MSFSKAISLAVLAGAVATLVGCAQRAPIPVAENFEYTSQPKVRSAGHWDLVSRDVVNQTLSTLDKAGVAPNTPLHVSLPANATQFETAFREFLITKLVQNGAVVQQNLGQALEVSYGIQVVRHSGTRSDPRRRLRQQHQLRWPDQHRADPDHHRHARWSVPGPQDRRVLPGKR